MSDYTRGYRDDKSRAETNFSREHADSSTITMSRENSPLLESHTYTPESLGTRHVQIFLMFLGIAIAYGVRVCMSVTIVAMTDAQSANPEFPEFNWDTKTNSIILSSFFWGYILTQVPCGYIANTRGAQKLLSCGVFLCSFLNLLIPILAIRYGWIAVICCRVATGLSQGCVFPCVQTLLSHWVPPTERARLGSFVMNAGTFGTVVTMPLSGTLAASKLGWPSVFYFSGAIGMAWSVLFFFMGADTPSEHPTICPKEMRYIDNCLGKSDRTVDSEKRKVPWIDILTSTPMWSLMIVHCGSNWGFYTMLTEMPTYMKSVLGFDVQRSGTVSAIPYLAMWVLGFPISWLSDFALKRGASVEHVRKVSNTIGLWIPAFAMIILCLMRTHDRELLIMVLVMAVGFSGGTSCGFQINHIDLSPDFAGTLMSITNSVANVFGILAPLACGVIVKDPTNEQQWHTVFYISALIYFLTNLNFIIFGKAETQPWSLPDVSTYPRRPTRVSRISSIYDPTSVAIVEELEEV